MKKYTVLTLVSILLVSLFVLAGCQSKESTSKSETKEVTVSNTTESVQKTEQTTEEKTEPEETVPATKELYESFYEKMVAKIGVLSFEDAKKMDFASFKSEISDDFSQIVLRDDSNLFLTMIFTSEGVLKRVSYGELDYYVYTEKLEDDVKEGGVFRYSYAINRKPKTKPCPSADCQKEQIIKHLPELKAAYNDFCNRLHMIDVEFKAQKKNNKLYVETNLPEDMLLYISYANKEDGSEQGFYSTVLSLKEGDDSIATLVFPNDDNEVRLNFNLVYSNPMPEDLAQQIGYKGEAFMGKLIDKNEKGFSVLNQDFILDNTDE